MINSGLERVPEECNSNSFHYFIDVYRSKKLVGMFTTQVRTKPTDKLIDLKFMKCFLRELVQNFKISQSDLCLTFFDLNDIFSAIERGEISNLRYFVDKKDICLDIQNKSGTITPLQLCIMKNNKQFVEVLWEKRANLNFPNKKKVTPLHTAAEVNALEIASFLLDKGALPSVKDENGFTPLHVASKFGNTQMIDLLIRKRADINAQVVLSMNTFTL